MKVAVVGAVALVLGAALGTYGTLYTTREQSKVQIQEQAVQAAADRAQSDREKRADVYGKFLQAANAYAVATDNFLAYASAKCTKPGVPCSPAFASLNNARVAFQASVNDVYVFGSDAAVQTEEALANTLPPSLWSDQLNVKFDRQGFTQAYQAFETVMCRELPADPRAGCR